MEGLNLSARSNVDIAAELIAWWHSHDKAHPMPEFALRTIPQGLGFGLGSFVVRCFENDRRARNLPQSI